MSQTTQNSMIHFTTKRKSYSNAQKKNFRTMNRCLEFLFKSTFNFLFLTHSFFCFSFCHTLWLGCSDIVSANAYVVCIKPITTYYTYVQFFLVTQSINLFINNPHNGLLYSIYFLCFLLYFLKIMNWIVNFFQLSKHFLYTILTEKHIIFTKKNWNSYSTQIVHCYYLKRSFLFHELYLSFRR